MNAKILLLALASQLAFAHAKVIPSGHHGNTTRATEAVRLSRASASSVGVVAIYGYPNCDFSSAISIAGQTVKLLLDTGSSNNAVSGSTCSGCTTDGVKTLYTDKSGQSRTTSVSASYGDGSNWSGYLTTGISTSLSPAGEGAGATMAVSADMTVITSESSFFNTQCSGFNSGIMGLAYSALAESGEIPYPDSLVSAGMPNAFGIHVCPISQDYSINQRVGNLYLGGFPSTQLASAMLFTPITSESYYQISMSGFAMGSTTLSVGSLSSYTQIVDSGTSAMALPTSVYNTVLAAIQKANPLTLTGSSAGQSVSDLYNGYTLGPLPATDLQFSTADSAILYLLFPDATASGSTIRVPIHPKDYFFVTAPNSAGEVTVEFMISSSSSDLILGGPAHMNKIVYYDRSNKRVGFGVAKACSYSGNTYNDIVYPASSAIDVIAPSTSDGSSGAGSGSGSGSGSATPTPTPSPSVSHTPTPTPSKAAVSHTPTPSPSKAAASHTPTPTATPSASASAAAAASSTPTPTPSPSHGTSPSHSPSHAVSPSATPSPSSAGAGSGSGSSGGSGSGSSGGAIPSSSPVAVASPSMTPSADQSGGPLASPAGTKNAAGQTRGDAALAMASALVAGTLFTAW